MKPAIKDKVYVVIQFALFFFFLYNKIKIDLPFLFSYVGLIMVIIAAAEITISLAQLNNNLSVFPTPLDSAELVEKGFYKFIRHPIYSGIIVGALGFALFSSSGSRLIISILLYVLFYFKSNYEEELLCKKYPEYKDYMARTGKFLPRIKKFSKN